MSGIKHEFTPGGRPARADGEPNAGDRPATPTGGHEAHQRRECLGKDRKPVGDVYERGAPWAAQLTLDEIERAPRHRVTNIGE
ncbi:hypothetical protein [Palleronia sp.]|uniref:hypothetical protein n=1 Tax=Palleronia sp. TaxID=1940284 RepID=UPI0035C7D025